MASASPVDNSTRLPNGQTGPLPAPPLHPNTNGMSYGALFAELGLRTDVLHLGRTSNEEWIKPVVPNNWREKRDHGIPLTGPPMELLFPVDESYRASVLCFLSQMPLDARKAFARAAVENIEAHERRCILRCMGLVRAWHGSKAQSLRCLGTPSFDDPALNKTEPIGWLKGARIWLDSQEANIYLYLPVFYTAVELLPPDEVKTLSDYLEAPAK